MDLTIMQNGAVYAVQQTRKDSWRDREPANADTSGTLPTIRTSVGEFAFRSTNVGCFLELIVGEAHRILGLYETNESALEALINQRTGLGSWDALAGSAAKSQISDRSVEAMEPK